MMFRYAPTVFAVGNCYQIMIPVYVPALVTIRIQDRDYCDETNGIMNSQHRIHRVEVPMDALDMAKEYTVFIKPLIRRSPYHTRTGKAVGKTYSFRPVPQKDIRVYHIADTHNKTIPPLKAAQVFGKIDLLILNGDIMDHCGSARKFERIYRICATLGQGAIPVVFARGNHDMRGKFAEEYPDYTPNQNGKTYYSFRLGGIWGVVLDCGEDKSDDHPEYGGMVACHDFRVRQTDFLNDLIANSENEYEAEGIHTRLVICHVPFTQREETPFDIEEDVYRQWSKLLREKIQPDLMLCGHTHQAEIRYPGHERDSYGQPCPVVIGSGYDDRYYWIGCGLILYDQFTEMVFTDSNGKILSSDTVFRKGVRDNV